MADLRELTTDAKRLYEALNYLLEKQDLAHAEDMNFKEIWFGAKARPFKGHILCKKDEGTCRRYLVMLAAQISLAGEANKKTLQVRFLGRILAACDTVKFDIKEIITDGMLVEERSIDEFQKIKDEELKIALLIDMFLLSYLDGKPEERQLDFAIGFMALMGLNQETAKSIKGILEQEDSLVLKQNTYLRVENMYCYMKNLPDGSWVSDLEKAKSVKAEKIIFNDLEWKAIAMIDCKEYKAHSIDFVNCSFYGIQGIVNRDKNKKIRFLDCQFINCEVEENLLTMRDTLFRNCIFKGIESFDSKKQHLFQFMDCEIENVIFEDVSIQHNFEYSGGGGLLKALNCPIREMTVQRLITKADWSRTRNIIDLYGGRIYNCEFLDCKLDGTSYLLTSSEKTVKSNLVVKNLQSEFNSNWENRNRDRNGYDTPLEQQFGGDDSAKQ